MTIASQDKDLLWFLAEGTAGTVGEEFFQRLVEHTALAFRAEHTQRVSTYDEFKAVMEGRPGFVIAPWCGSAKCEADIKAETQATIRNIPFTSKPATGKTCLKCNGAATTHAWFAKSY